MRLLLKTFLVSSGICAVLLFWFRPAQNLISVTPIDWQAEYKKQYGPDAKFYGFSGAMKRLLRDEQPQPSLAEYIDQKTKDHLIQAKSADWQKWLTDRLSSSRLAETEPSYFRSTDPLMSVIAGPNGYVEVKGKDHSEYVWFARMDPSALKGKSIPASMRYPDRHLAIILFGAILISIVISRLRPPVKDLISITSSAAGSKVFMGILTGGGALVIMPFLYGWDNNFPPFVFMGGFVMIFGLIGLAVFGWQTAFAENLIKGKDLWAHWTFDPKAGQDFAEKELKQETKEKKELWLFISAIILIVGGLFWLLVRDEAAGFVFLFLIGLIALLGLIALVVPRLSYRFNRHSNGEIFLGKDGLYFNGAVHTWSFLGARFESAEYLLKSLPMLQITYSYLVTAGRTLYFYRQNAVVRVPVPKGKEAEAQNIVARYQEKY